MSLDAPATPAPSARLAYLVSQYPLVSHTFIEREVAGLRCTGTEVHTFSARATPHEGLLSPEMRDEARTTTPLIDTSPRALLSLARQVFAEPSIVLGMVWTALRTGERRPAARLKQLLYLAEAFRLNAEMRRRDLRHVHVHFANNGADIARLAVALGRRQDGPSSEWSWSMTMHGPTELEAVEHFDLAAKVVSASGVACISDFTRSQLMRLVPSAEWGKLQIVPMSVDLDALGPPPTREARDTCRILHVGRLVPEKGAPVLLEALQELKRRGVDFDARLVGAGPLADELAAQVDRLGLSDHVDLTGALNQDAVRECYAWADVFCLPSFQEGLPVVLMEALATGLPVVTTRIAGIPELVQDGVVGRVLSPGRADQLADALHDLAGNPQRRIEWGARGPDLVRSRHELTVAADLQHAFLHRQGPR